MARGPCHPRCGRWSFARALGVSVHVVPAEHCNLLCALPFETRRDANPGPGRAYLSDWTGSPSACSVLFLLDCDPMRESWRKGMNDPRIFSQQMLSDPMRESWREGMNDPRMSFSAGAERWMHLTEAKR